MMSCRILICWFLLSACLATSINGGRVRRKPFIPNFNDKCWSPWLDDERLGISTDNDRVETEKISAFRRYDSTLVCSEPERIECRRVVDQTPSGDDVSRCDVTYGLQCIASPGKDGDCADYEIRLLCPTPCHPNGTLYTLTTAATPVDFLTTIQYRSEVPTMATVDPIMTGSTPMNGNSQSIVPGERTTAREYTPDSAVSTDNPPVLETTVVNGKTSEVASVRPIDQSSTIDSVKTSGAPSIGPTDQSSSVVPDRTTPLPVQTSITATSSRSIITDRSSSNAPDETAMSPELKTTASGDTSSMIPTPLTVGITTEVHDLTSNTNNGATTSDITRGNLITMPSTESMVQGTTPSDNIVSKLFPEYTELPRGDTTIASRTESNVVPNTMEPLTSSGMGVSIHSTTDSDTNNPLSPINGATEIFTLQAETTEELTEAFRLTSTQSLETKAITKTPNFTQGDDAESCGSISCYNGGTCYKPTRAGNRLKCNCTDGWEGRQCHKDGQAPVIECPPNIKRVVSSTDDSRYVSWDMPTVMDNDGFHNSTLRSNVSYGTFSVGKVIVEYTAEDFAGNIAKPCTFKIVLFVGCKYSMESNLTWRRVEVNKYRSSQEKCPTGTPRAGMPKGTRYCGSDDDGNAIWMSPVIQDCLQSITTTTKSDEQREKELVNLSKTTITAENVTEVADELTTLTDGIEDVSVEMFNAIADTLDNIVNVGSTSLEVTAAVFSAVSNVISANMGNADIAISSTKIVKAVDTQVGLAQQGQGRFQVKEENLAVMANTNNQSVVEGGLGFASIQTEGNVGEAGLESTKWKSFQNADAVPLTGVDVSCKIPEEIGQYIGADLQISYVIYGNGMLFSSPLTSGVNATTEVMSRVMSVSAKDTKVTNLQDPVAMSFGIPPSKSNYDNATCVYWDFTLQDGIGDWSSDGCVMNTTNDDVITCYCNHLTHFAVLLEFKRKDVKPNVLFALVLISRVGCLVSIACLIATLIAFLSFRRLRCERPQRILISLSVSLLCLYIMFIIGIEPGDRGTERQKNKCMVSAALLHYFTLTSIFWMAVEAVNLYYNLIKVFKSKVSLFMLKASIFAWGVPGILVGGMVGWQTTRQEYMNDEYCFMAIGYPFYVTLALPVALCLIFNVIVFMRVMFELMCRRKRSSSSNDSRWENLSKRAQNAFGISVLLGLTWIFGFLTFNIEHDYIFDLLFCVFNSLQGVFVFLFFCVRQKDVRITWKKCLCGQKQASYNIGSSSGSSTRYTNRSGRPASANIDLLGKPHNELVQNGNGSPAIYDYNNGTVC